MKAKLVYINVDKIERFATLDIEFPKDAHATFHSWKYGSKLTFYRPTWQDMRAMAFVLLDATGGR